jgi:hypothetical protein
LGIERVTIGRKASRTFGSFTASKRPNVRLEVPRRSPHRRRRDRPKPNRFSTKKDGVIASEISQTEKGKHHMFSL